MIEKQLISILLNMPDYYDDFKRYGNIFITDDCIKLYNIMESIKKNHGNISNELIIDYISENKNYNIKTYYEIYDMFCDEENYKPLVSKILTRKITNDLKRYIFEVHKIDRNYIDIKYDIQNMLDSVTHIEDEEITDTKKECIDILGKLKENYIPKKIYSGIDFIDENQGGYDITDYVVIGAAESVGKTSMAIDLTVKQLKKDLRVAFFSCEMKKNKIHTLMACNLSMVNTKKIDLNIMSEKEKNDFINIGLDRLYGKPLFIDDSSREWSDIRRKIKMLKKRENIDIAYIDYLQYVRVKGINNMYDRLEVVSTGIKNLAKEIDIPIVVIAALNRVGKNEDEPKSHHIKGNGDIEYDADIICLLKTVQLNVLGDYNKRQVDRYITKNRNGMLGKEELLYLPPIRRFRTWDKTL